jgi:general L-amino acid transport system substrate-binding protein
MHFAKSILTIVLAPCALVLSCLSAQAADPTLPMVKKRGELLCGINGQLPGFSSMDEQKRWSGFEVDFCRAVAAAALGDAARVKLIPLTAGRRFDALREGEIDVLARNTTATLERTSGTGVRDAAVIYVDGQAVIVPKNLGIDTLDQVANHNVCILNGTPYGRNIQDWFEFRKLRVTTVAFDTQKDMYEAFFSGKCDALTQDISAITTTIVATGKAADYLVLPGIIARDPLAAYVRGGDEQWLDVVRWTFYALLDGEERNITQANVESQRRAGTPAVKRLLGVPPDDAKLLGLDDVWAFNIISQVGNYKEIYERNLGQSSVWKFPRGINALWSNGGVLHALPLR